MNDEFYNLFYSKDALCVLNMHLYQIYYRNVTEKPLN